MGQGYSCTCPQCGFHEVFFHGIGFMWGSEELEFIRKDILKGVYGSAAQTMLQETPSASFEAEQAAYKCSKCGQLEQSLCIKIRPSSESHWVTVRHQCNRCKAVMHRMKTADELTCPDCHSKLNVDDRFRWD